MGTFTERDDEQPKNIAIQTAWTHELLEERAARLTDTLTWSRSWHWDRSDDPNSSKLSLNGVRQMANDVKMALSESESRIARLWEIMPEVDAYLAKYETEEVQRLADEKWCRDHCGKCEQLNESCTC